VISFAETNVTLRYQTFSFNSPTCVAIMRLVRDDAKAKGGSPRDIVYIVWFMACTAYHNYRELLRDTTFLQPKGGGHECSRPTPSLHMM